MRGVTVAAVTGLVVAGLATAGCGSKSTTGPVAGTCTVTLSGAMTGTYDCTPAALAWASATDTSGFGLSITSSGSHPDLTLAIAWAGHPATGDYVTGASANSGGGISITNGGTPTWAALTGAAPQGSWDLKLTNIGPGISVTNGTGYPNPTGTLSATVPAITPTGASGTINVSVTF